MFLFIPTPSKQWPPGGTWTQNIWANNLVTAVFKKKKHLDIDRIVSALYIIMTIYPLVYIHHHSPLVWVYSNWLKKYIIDGGAMI